MKTGWERTFNIVFAVGIIGVIIFLWIVAKDIENVMLTVNVPIDAEVIDVMTTLNALGETPATFFLPAVWAHNNPEIAKNISDSHEVACYTSRERRLVQLSREELYGEIVECKLALEQLLEKNITGFRAPENDVGGYAKTLIEEHFLYDSSQYRRFEWFYEPIAITELPVTTFLVVPLDDKFGIGVFGLGDLFYTLIRYTKQTNVVVALDATRAATYALDIEYTIASLKNKNVTFMTMQEFMRVGAE